MITSMKYSELSHRHTVKSSMAKYGYLNREIFNPVFLSSLDSA